MDLVVFSKLEKILDNAVFTTKGYPGSIKQLIRYLKTLLKDGEEFMVDSGITRCITKEGVLKDRIRVFVVGSGKDPKYFRTIEILRWSNNRVRRYETNYQNFDPEAYEGLPGKCKKEGCKGTVYPVWNYSEFAVCEDCGTLSNAKQ